MRILVTGATGNVGEAVVESLISLDTKSEIVAAVRDIHRAKKQLPESDKLGFAQFDFENTATFESAFSGVDILFLLRPPHIAEVDKVFKPLLESARNAGISRVVFLSVQGAEKSSVIPHNKIEKLIRELGLEFIFVRPSYFMQNLTTTLHSEISEHRSVTLPSGNAVFNWIDVRNIGEAAAQLILNFETHKNQAFEITGSENKSFPEVVELINKLTHQNIQYKSINPISFYFKKRREGMSHGFTIVMTVIHFLRRFQKDPEISPNYENLTSKKPTTLSEFILREKNLF